MRRSPRRRSRPAPRGISRSRSIGTLATGSPHTHRSGAGRRRRSVGPGGRTGNAALGGTAACATLGCATSGRGPGSRCDGGGHAGMAQLQSPRRQSRLGDTTIVDVKAADRPRYLRSLFWLGTRIADIGLWAGAAALLAIVVLNAINIVLRYFFNAPLSWAEEALLYLMIFGVCVGAVSVAWQQAHIRIGAVLAVAPPARRRI